MAITGTFDFHARGIKWMADMLEDAKKNELPKAVQKTLTELAWDLKGSRGRAGLIEIQSRDDFDYIRRKSFIRGLTWAVPCKERHNINRMKSGAGIVERPRRTKAAHGVAKQQTASPIKNKYAPTPSARAGDLKARGVRRKYYKGVIMPPINATSAKGDEFYKKAARAAIDNRAMVVRGRKKSHRNYVVMVEGWKVWENGNTKPELRFLYQENPGGRARLKKKRPFVDRAGAEVMKKAPKLFTIQVDKYLFR
jgi:hypothetical protein